MKSGTELDGQDCMTLQQENVGSDVQSTTRVHVPEAREGRWLGEKMESNDVSPRRRCEDS